jgi:hypothetical protein
VIVPLTHAQFVLFASVACKVWGNEFEQHVV